VLGDFEANAQIETAAGVERARQVGAAKAAGVDQQGSALDAFVIDAEDGSLRSERLDRGEPRAQPASNIDDRARISDQRKNRGPRRAGARYCTARHAIHEAAIIK
jgi:hypothetical protein